MTLSIRALFCLSVTLGISSHQVTTTPPPLAARKNCFDDLFFVTGGGLSEPAPFCEKQTRTDEESRPKSTPFVGSRSKKRAGVPEFATTGLTKVLARRARTADVGSLARLRFRAEPIRNLVSATLRIVDPSGMFNVYKEWSDVKNRVLSSEFFFFFFWA